MLFAHELRMPCDVLLGRLEQTLENTNEYISHPEERILTIHQWAREKLHFSSEKMKDRYNAKTFKEGKMVWLHYPQGKKGLSPKLQYQWEGPYKLQYQWEGPYRLQYQWEGPYKLQYQWEGPYKLQYQWEGPYKLQYQWEGPYKIIK
ncbi:hypothetical protein LAZ67_12000327 [Cordylochernes scorpioides]|uniref:Uncharacterized protein n=1 Tax=Cordylochernes scorpioides TaxID=51811 RepID=A0ABY6L4D7_9ARAC|nr:hypothetical protein LAZ67_12000327 [Cordylochernes scorpioides]